MTTATLLLWAPAADRAAREVRDRSDVRRLPAPSLGLALMGAAALWVGIGTTVALLLA